MSRKVISFLGVSAKPTVYEYQGKTYTGNVFPAALRQFVAYDEMLVFVTRKAEEKTWPVLEKLGDPRIRPVPITKGESPQEMWGWFDKMLECVADHDTVVFDITHGLRSIPFLVFVFAAFLKAARNVTIEAIYYGAYELGNPKDGKPAPVIDLSEFVTMFDWLVATDYFTETGDGRALAKLLKEQMPPGIRMQKDLDARNIGRNLRDASQAINDITLALRVARPMETMRASLNLAETMKKTRNTVTHNARPFGVLVDEVAKEYGQFSLDKPEDCSNWKTNLRNQLLMIQWYLEHEQTIQAVTLSREWVVSALAVHFGKDLLLRSDRLVVEKMLNNAVEQSKAEPRPIEPTELDEQYQLLPHKDEITSLWSRLTEIRNDIAHVGMRKSAQPAKRLKERVSKFFPELEKIAKIFDLT